VTVVFLASEGGHLETFFRGVLLAGILGAGGVVFALWLVGVYYGPRKILAGGASILNAALAAYAFWIVL
jgi:hypothetical protein